MSVGGELNVFHKYIPKSGETKKNGKKLLIKPPGDRPWYWLKSLFAKMGNIDLYPFVCYNRRNTLNFFCHSCVINTHYIPVAGLVHPERACGPNSRGS